MQEASKFSRNAQDDASLCNANQSNFSATALSHISLVQHQSMLFCGSFKWSNEVREEGDSNNRLTTKIRTICVVCSFTRNSD
jgi:hypothetical protein